MREYKCICCSETRQSDQPCFCPTCGYRMFEMPFDRKNVLVSEIKGFVSRLEVTTIIREDLEFEGKDKDDFRFPSYDQVLKYVAKRDRTEDFLDNLLETVEQLKLHYTSSFSKMYPVSFENIDGIIQQYDELLNSAAQILAPGSAAVLDPVVWEKVTLCYSETQNKYLWFSADELLDLIGQLAKKIVSFIKVNNLYGNNHKFFPEKRERQNAQNADFKDELEDAISATEKIIRKKYVVDILDDGAAELREMLTCRVVAESTLPRNQRRKIVQ